MGAGPAGSACALTLARKGAKVLLLEKARIPGERNMTGGVLLGGFTGHYGLIDLIPGFESEAPVQRKIVSHEVQVLSKPDAKKGTYRHYKLDRNSLPAKLGIFGMNFETGHDYSVLRRDFDHWFAYKAAEAGAMLATQTTVHALLKEGNSIVGVRTSDEEIRTKLVIDCSGVTSNLVEMAGLRDKLGPSELYHGIKHTYRLNPATIEERFRVKKGEGRAILCLGDFMEEIGGGAFLYTNNDTLSVGIVASMDSMLGVLTTKFNAVGKLLDVLEAFEAHPMIAELLEGAELMEYSAHNIPKGYKSILKRPYTDGYLVAGDALGTFAKVGPLLDGIRTAIASGIMAAECFRYARELGSFGAAKLARYKDLLAPIYGGVARSGRDSFLSESGFVYHTLPRVLFASSLFCSEDKIRVTKPTTNLDAVQRVQANTSLLNYDEDKVHSHITVNSDLAAASPTKPWVPACPVNCYTLLTPEGVFASYKDLFYRNLSALLAQSHDGKKNEKTAALAYEKTLNDIRQGQLRFDHVACVACGTCGEIGPKEMVYFDHERDGHGVRYKFG